MSLTFADKVVYELNSAAVGDLVAAAPALKWSIETYHKEKEYKVAVYPEFRELFPFVPDDKITELTNDYDKSFAVRQVNMNGGGGNVCRLTPSRLKLTHYACIGLLGRIIPDIHLKYVPLPEVDVSKFGIDFSKAVVIVTTYRDAARAWRGSEISRFAKYIAKRGFQPVFVGREGKVSIWKTLAVSDFEYEEGLGIDLRNKTSLTELATIMGKSRAVVAVDGGPLHLAFTTNTPVIAGFTNVNPHLRVPPRNEGTKTIAVTPAVLCKFCQSDWDLDFWNFTKCPRGQALPDCTNELTAELFLNAFNKLDLTV